MNGEGKLKAYENRALKKIFGRKTREAAGKLGRLHNDHRLDLRTSLNITRLIKYRRMR
jgi:hypothetical protein